MSLKYSFIIFTLSLISHSSLSLSSSLSLFRVTSSHHIYKIQLTPCQPYHWRRQQWAAKTFGVFKKSYWVVNSSNNSSHSKLYSLYDFTQQWELVYWCYSHHSSTSYMVNTLTTHPLLKSSTGTWKSFILLLTQAEQPAATTCSVSQLSWSALS